MFTDLSDSDSDYSDSITATQPWVGHARTAWATEDKEPPLGWDTDPIPAIPEYLQQDTLLRYSLFYSYSDICAHLEINIETG